MTIVLIPSSVVGKVCTKNNVASKVPRSILMAEAIAMV